MHTIDTLFEAFGGTGGVAKALGVGPSTASEMRRRASIPVRYWPELVSQAEARGLTGIDYETLVAAHTTARPKSEVA